MLPSVGGRRAVAGLLGLGHRASAALGSGVGLRGYHERVVDHYNNPRNVGSFDKNDPTVGTGLVGAPACGDVMKLQIKVDENTGKIVDACFKTFGCGSAIASSSVGMHEWMLPGYSRKPLPYSFSALLLASSHFAPLSSSAGRIFPFFVSVVTLL